jgi:integrase
VNGAALPALVLDARRAELGRQAPAAYVMGLAAGSRRTMMGALRLIAGELGIPLESVPWHRLRAAHVGALRARLLAKLAPASCNKVLAALRGVLREAARLGLLTHEQLAAVLSVRGVTGSRELRGRALAPGELRALFQSCAEGGQAIGARDAAMLGVLYGCGLRRAEVAGLTLDALSSSGSAPGSRVGEAGGALELLVRGKGNRERRAYLPQGAADAMRAWLAWRGMEPGFLFGPVGKGGRVAPRRGMSDHAVALAVAARAKRAGVGTFSPHDLRRTLVGDLLDAGADLSAVQAIAGHRQVSTTARYDRRGERAKRTAADLVLVPWTVGDPPAVPLAASTPRPRPTSWAAAAERCRARGTGGRALDGLLGELLHG